MRSAFSAIPSPPRTSTVPRVRTCYPLHDRGSPAIASTGGSIVFTDQKADWGEIRPEQTLWIAQLDEPPVPLARTEDGSHRELRLVGRPKSDPLPDRSRQAHHYYEKERYAKIPSEEPHPSGQAIDRTLASRSRIRR